MSALGDQNGRAAAQLSAIHVCQNCGAGTRRCHVPLESVINGLVRCGACGYEGPLNIEVLADGDWSATPQIAPALGRQGQPALTRRSELPELSDRSAHEFTDNPARIITDR